MVQVDVVWSYAFGASFAAAAAKQLEKEESPWVNKYFVYTLLFLAIFFAPSGLYLVIEHPQWETMQVAKSLSDLPGWLVMLFAVTNITQGILGYWVSYKLAKARNWLGAHLNWIIAWIIFWFILVCGWDCTGYQRFMYDMSVNNGVLWSPGKCMGLSFFYASRVWWTLVAMAVIWAPMLLYGYIKYIREGMESDSSIPREDIPGPINYLLRIIVLVFGTQWIACLALAIAASLIVMKLHTVFGSLLPAYIVGILAFSIVAYFLLFKRNMLFHRLMKPLYLKD